MDNLIAERQPAGFFVNCPDCGEESRIQRRMLGATMRCRNCDCAFHLDPADPTSQLTAVFVFCPHCEKELRAGIECVGTKVACKFCRQPLAILAPSTSDSLDGSTKTDDARSAGPPKAAWFDLSDFELESVDAAEASVPQRSIATSPNIDVAGVEDSKAARGSRTSLEQGKVWFLRSRGRESGPYTLDALNAMAEKGKLSLDDELRPSMAGEWLPLRSFHELFAAVKVAALPSAPANSPATAPTSSTRQPPIDSSDEVPDDFDEVVRSALRFDPSGRPPETVAAAPSFFDEPARLPAVDDSEDAAQDDAAPQPDAPVQPHSCARSEPVLKTVNDPGPANHFSHPAGRATVTRGSSVAASSVLFLRQNAVAVAAVLGVGLLGVLIVRWFNSRSLAPDVVIVEDKTFDENRPTAVMLQALMHDKSIEHNGRTWNLMPVTNVELIELSAKDGEGYQTATVTLDTLDEGTPALHATVELIFKTLRIEKDGGQVLHADYDVKSLKKISASPLPTSGSNG